MREVTRRKFLATATVAAAGAAAGPWVLRAQAQAGPVKVGVVLPYTGVYAELGVSITQGMKLVFARENDMAAGRKIEMIQEDDARPRSSSIRTRWTSSPVPCTAASSWACVTRSTTRRPS